MTHGTPRLVVALGLVCGCALSRAAPTPGARHVGAEALPGEVRVRVRGLASNFSGVLEGLADGLAGPDASALVKREALRVKLVMVPLMQAALFQPDPVLALVDAWALVAQLDDRLVRWARERPGETTRVEAARAGLATLDGQLGEVWASLRTGRDVDDVRARVYAWAAENPFERLGERRSPVELFAALPTNVASLGEVATQVVENTRDLTARFDLQTVWFPKVARWHAEFLLLEMNTDPAMGVLPAGVVADVDAIAAVLARMPARLDFERRVALDALRTELEGLRNFVTGEREALVSALAAERATVMSSVDGLAARAVDRAFDRLDRIVERVLLWLTLLMVLALVAMLLVRRGVRRQPRPQPPRVPPARRSPEPA